MGLAYNLGSVIGGSIREFVLFKNPFKKPFKFFLLFMVVNQIRVPDYIVKDWIDMGILIFGLIVIYGAISFRIYLIGKAISKRCL